MSFDTSVAIHRKILRNARERFERDPSWRLGFDVRWELEAAGIKIPRKKVPKLLRIDNPKNGKIDGWMFFCLGCDTHHYFDKRWTFNGDQINPTFTPSLLVHGMEGVKRCHLYVRCGKIVYLNDCEHALAGKTVEMNAGEWR